MENMKLYEFFTLEELEIMEKNVPAELCNKIKIIKNEINKNNITESNNVKFENDKSLQKIYNCILEQQFDMNETAFSVDDFMELDYRIFDSVEQWSKRFIDSNTMHIGMLLTLFEGFNNYEIEKSYNKGLHIYDLLLDYNKSENDNIVIVDDKIVEIYW